MSDAVVSISDLTVTGGVSDYGGGVCNYGTLSMHAVVVADCAATSSGGGIGTGAGVLTLVDCTIVGNTAEKNGGGISGRDMILTGGLIEGNTATGTVYWGGWGGGICVAVGYTVEIIDTTISDNVAVNGGGICASGATLVLEGSPVISGNHASVNGGGIISRVGSEMSVQGCTITGNTAEKNGGGIRTEDASVSELRDCTISGNTATGTVYWGGWGGGVSVWVGDQMEIFDSTISENVAVNGGGICASGATLTLEGSGIVDNTASVNGGGICSRVDSELGISGCAIARNTAGKNGGGLYHEADDSAEASLVNCTISSNAATGTVDRGGYGGGIGNFGSGVVSLCSCTVTANTALFGGAITNGKTLLIKNTILSGNAANVNPTLRGDGEASSFGYNLLASVDGHPYAEIENSGTDVFGENPILGPLTDNGGATLTHALLSGSPAINAGGCTDIAGGAVAVDQRAILRPQSGACDIGAYESDLSGAVIPDSPSELMVTAISSYQIGLSWLDNSDSEDGFRIERRTVGSSYSEIDIVAPNATSYSDTAFGSATTYCYRVRAYNASGDSGYSNEDCAITASSVPSAPSSLGGTAASSSRIDLSWEDNSDNEDGFKIERKVEGGSYNQIDTVPADAVTYMDTGLDSATSYCYRIRAYSAVGDSEPSNEACTPTLEVGDVNGNGLVDLIDVLILYRYVEGVLGLSPEELLRADIDQDGDVDTDDVLALAGIVFGS